MRTKKLSKSRFTPVFLGVLILGFTQSGWAQSSGGGDSGHSGVRRKYERKLQARWSLAEWMDQKQKMKWQDQWLAIHTSDNPYEFFLEGEHTEQDRTYNDTPNTPEKHKFFRGRAGAYASIIGLEGVYDLPHKNWSATEGSLHLRIFGTAVQNTNLTLLGGVRINEETNTTTSEVERFQNPFGGVSLTLYVNRFFGILGEYRMLFSEKSNKSNSLWGESSRGTFFIDFAFIRIYGGASRDFYVFNDTEPTRRSQTRDGVFGGLRFFF